MDLSLSNLEIETTLHPHSSSQKEEEIEDECQRNWVDLPPDVMSLIFLKLGAVPILESVQWVCSSWWKFSKQPHLFHSILVDDSMKNSNLELSREMVREAIDRSCGQLLKFSIETIADDELLHYMSEKSGSLRYFRLVNNADYVTDHGLIKIAKKLPQLEELEIILFSYFSKHVFETFGRFCPHLKSCQFINLGIYLTGSGTNRVALTIPKKMLELRHLSLFGNRLTDDSLRAFLDGCPHLEYLDLRQCFGLQFAGDLKERYGNIKVVRLPSDLIDNDEDNEF